MYATRLHAAAIVILLAPAMSTHASIEPQPPGHQRLQVPPDNRAAHHPLTVRVGRPVGTNRELLVTCGSRTKLLTFNTVDRRFCDAQLRCSRNLREVLAGTCAAGPSSLTLRTPSR